MRCARDPVIRRVLAALGFSFLQQLAMAQPSPVVPLKALYTDTPEFTTAMMGNFSMDVALVDLDRNGHVDLLIANGSDMSPQQLVLFRNRIKETRNVFRPWPDWRSEATEYMAGMAVGDVNQDGWMDVAVAVAFDQSRDISTGSVMVFLNVNGELQGKPAFETAPGGFMPVDCALADVDADGDVDLIVPALLEGTGIWGGEGPLSSSLGRARIYLNTGGNFSSNPDWTSATRLGAGSVTAADINQDGWIDLAFGSPQPTIFYGKQAPPNHITIPQKAGWMATTPPVKAEIPVYRVDAGSHGNADQQKSTLPARDAGLMLAVSPGCATSSDRPCESPFYLYRPDQRKEPIWTSDTARFPGGITLADLNQDGYLDLVAGQWGATFPGGPIWLFQGPFPTTFPTASKPTLEIPRQRVWQAFRAANLRCEPVESETLTHTFTVDGPANVLTLPQRILSDVVEVWHGKIPLSPKLWTWSPEANWVSLADPVDDTVITVKYKSPKILDLATAIWNPNHGSDVFFSFLRSCPE